MLGGIRLPVAWFASRPLGYEGIWVAFAVSNVCGAALGYVWYQRGTWRDADLTEGTPAASAADSGRVPEEGAGTDAEIEVDA